MRNHGTTYKPEHRFPSLITSKDGKITSGFGNPTCFTVGEENYTALLFPMRSDTYNRVIQTLGGKPLGPKTGWILDFHLEHSPMRDASGKLLPPVLHRERWYPTEEKMRAAAIELNEFLSSMTIEEAMNLNLPDFRCPRAGAKG